jgi:hypothetical protein
MADPKDLEQAALDKVNQDRAWVVTNMHWLIALAGAFVLGLIVGIIV